MLLGTTMSAKSAASRGCSIQFASDLHLEGVFGRRREPPVDLIIPAAKYLVLAGDICTLTPDVLPPYTAWLRRVAADFERVFVLAGNHEYYGVSLAEGRAALALACAGDPRITFLDRTRVELEDGVVLLGCTLWSHVPKYAESAVLGLLNDYRVIRPAADAVEATRGGSSGSDTSPVAAAVATAAISAAGEAATAKDPRAAAARLKGPLLARAIHAELTAEHDTDVGWLSAEVQRATRLGQRVVIATHHAPTFQGTSAPQFATPLWNPSNAGFASNLEHLFATFGAVGSLTGEAAAVGGDRKAINSNVRAWIYGHTHFNCDNVIHGTVSVWQFIILLCIFNLFSP